MTELEIRIEFAKRQFQWMLARAQHSWARGMHDAANNWLGNAEDCNTEIDRMLRKLHNVP